MKAKQKATQKNKFSLKTALRLITIIALSLALLNIRGGTVNAASTTGGVLPLSSSQVNNSLSNFSSNGFIFQDAPAGDWVTTHDTSKFTQYGVGYGIDSSAICNGATISQISFALTDTGNLGAHQMSIFGLSDSNQNAQLLPISSNVGPGSIINANAVNDSYILPYGDSSVISSGTNSFTITYDFSSGPLSSADLSRLIMVSMHVIESSSGGGANMSAITTLPVATITYDDSACYYPIATDPDSATTSISMPVTMNILGNDTGSNLKITKIDGQSISTGQTINLSNGSGVVTLNSDGTITFTPADGFSGQSNFPYSISDGTNEIDTGVVNITVSGGAVPVYSSGNDSSASTKTNGLKTLANTGTSLILALNLSLMMVISGFCVSRFTKNKS